MYHEDRLVEVGEKLMGANPWKSIGLIEILTGGKKDGHGTGILVSPNLVLTCAHNIYNPASFPKNDKDSTKDYFAKELRFYPGHRGELKKYY
jgi:V8-like Glu-specific endopeptidase